MFGKISWLLVLLIAVGCGSSKKKVKKNQTVSVQLVSVQPTAVPGQQGMALAITRTATIAYLEVIERSPNARSVTRITNSEDPAFQVGPPVPSPVGGAVAFQVLETDQTGTTFSKIWLQTVPGTARTSLTFGKWLDLFPAFSHDGKNIVFASNRTSAKHTLWRIAVGGGAGITMVTNSQAEDYAPAFAPNNTTVAYTSIPSNASMPQIWTVDLSSGLPTQLREGSWPSVSPDGKQILFVRRDKNSGRYQIWRLNMDGGKETQLTQNTKHDVFAPQWSSDGNWIVFSSDEGRDSRKRNNLDIWLMKANGSNKTQVTTNGSVDDHPRWGPEGKIYFRSNRGGTWNIWRLDPLLPN